MYSRTELFIAHLKKFNCPTVETIDSSFILNSNRSLLQKGSNCFLNMTLIVSYMNNKY